MKTIFAKKEAHVPKYFVIDATGKTLGRLACQVSVLLMGANTSTHSPGVDQGNFVIILNAEKIIISGKKIYKKKYFNTSQRPGGLKSITFSDLNKKMPDMPLKKAILGMLPKNKLRKIYLKRLFIYSSKKELGQRPFFLSNLKTTWIF